MSIEGREGGHDLEKQEFKEGFLNKETARADVLIQELFDKDHVEAYYPSITEEQRVATIKELEDLKKRIKKSIEDKIEVFSKYYTPQERANRIESNLEELAKIEKLPPSIRKIYKEKTEAKERMKEIDLENRILEAIKEEKF